MPEALLQADNLCVVRGEQALFKAQSFSIESGALFQLQGDNGSGKTTLLRTLCTLIPLDQGELKWRGESLPAARDQYFAEMCFAGHSDGVKGDLTALENVKSSLSASPLSKSALSESECMEALAQTGLAGREHLPCRVLSAGQRRRVVLARVLLSRAVLWILDEPLTALDADGRELVAALIESHVGTGGSVLYSTHQPLQISDRQVQTLVLTQ